MEFTTRIKLRILEACKADFLFGCVLKQFVHGIHAPDCAGHSERRVAQHVHSCRVAASRAECLDSLLGC